MIQINKIHNLECISGMMQMEDSSVDMILCDLPYGITDCKWDSIIPFSQLWEQYCRIAKPNAAIVLTSSQPFTTKLIQSNQKNFKYCWYWIKNQVTGFPFAKFQPLRCVEDICIFYRKMPTYNPQGLVLLDKPRVNTRKVKVDNIYDVSTLSKTYITRYTNYPRQVLEFNCQRDGFHPTQKPVELFEYLIKTYTNEGDIILDNCMGSGTTAIAAINTNRQFVGFEIDNSYCNIANERITKAYLNRDRL